MAVSGSTDFEPDVQEYIEEAFERCGFVDGARTGYDLRTARRSLNLLLADWANRGINRWTITNTKTDLVASTESYSLGAETIDVLGVLYRENHGLTTQSDRILYRMSRQEYLNIPNKLQTGTPAQFYVDRQIAPTIKLWPVPNDSTDDIVYDRLVRMDDADAYENTLEVPFRYYPALAAGLAFYLAIKKAPDRVPLLKAMYDEELLKASLEDRDRASFRVTPDMRGY